VARDDEVVDGLIARASGLTTCHISDALDRRGLPPGGLVGIRPLEPAKRAVGLAFPVQLRAADGNSADRETTLITFRLMRLLSWRPVAVRTARCGAVTDRSGRLTVVPRAR
jgi:hypothetical protein